jgi:two-component system cell cycle response regulator
VASQQQKDPAAPALGFSRVLIASPDSLTVKLLGRHLREWGYAPVEAADGAAAVRLLTEANGPRIAILDSILPVLSGEEVSAKVRNSSMARPVWTLMLCDHADRSTIAGATDAGIDDLVLKPVDVTNLRIKIGVAERVQVLMNQLESLTDAARFHESHDKLTGLLNRDSLLRMLFAETDRAQRLNVPLTLVVLDLDYFSRINLEYGYEAGDKILQELARRFRRCLRSYDLIGRCGEDEFLIALPGCTSAEAYELAQRVKRTILHRPFCVGRNMMTLTASAGISHSYGRSPLLVLREAERAMASAKLSGRNCERQFVRVEMEEAQRADKQRADRRRLSVMETKH